MKRTLERVKVSLNERDVIDALCDYVTTHHPDLSDETFEVTVTVKKGIYSAEVEVKRK